RHAALAGRHASRSAAAPWREAAAAADGDAGYRRRDPRRGARRRLLGPWRRGRGDRRPHEASRPLLAAAAEAGGGGADRELLTAANPLWRPAPPCHTVAKRPACRVPCPPSLP